MRGAPEPAGKEVLGHPQIGVVPELADALLEDPGPGYLEVAALQRAEDSLLLGRHVLGAQEPEVLGPRQPMVTRLLQGPLLRPPHPIHRVMEVRGEVELVEDDLGLGLREMGVRRLDRGLPHVHGDRRDPVPLRRRHGRPPAP